MGLIKLSLLVTRTYISIASAKTQLNAFVTKVVKRVTDWVRRIVWAAFLVIIILISQLVIYYVIMDITEINQIFAYRVAIIV